ncbi:MAG: GNAT family N-acetyltransferase [Anaerolineae bacterium]|nr:GNAT family N-acetyltransferase [Anaerolineae bacterium]
MSLYEGKFVRLTQFRHDDLPVFMQWFRDYETQRLLVPGVAFPITDEAEEVFYQQAVKESESAYYFSIHTLESDLLIGNCSLFAINQRNRSADFGIVVGEKAYWGRGYGSDATRILLGFAFQEVNLNRVQLEVFDYNARAIRSYEKVGFAREGVRRQALFREGAYHDIILMAILRDDWHPDLD